MPTSRLVLSGLALCFLTLAPSVPAKPQAPGQAPFAASPARRSALDPPASVPNQWQMLEALPAPERKLDPDEPVVDVGAEANAVPPGPSDLDPTIDVQITQEIIDKASELGTPAAMYEFVRNECRFQAYFGSQQGSVETLHQLAGNDFDLASLLIALLRASGVPARYAVGMVEMPAERATSWLGVDDAEVAGSILTTHGLEGINIIDGMSQVVAVRARRVWVEAFVPLGYGGSAWVPLDPSFKQHEIQPGQDIPAAMSLDAQAFVDNYWDPVPPVTLPRPETVLEILAQDIQAYLDANLPGTTVADVRRTTEVVPEELEILPFSLPYTVRSRDTQYSEIPANRRYQVRFHLYDGGTTLIDHTVNLPEVAGRRITIDYVGATPGDQATIDANGGIYQTPPATVDLTPVIRLAGSDIATGTAGIGMALTHNSDVHFLAPTNGMGLPNNVVPAIFNTMVAGASEAHAFATDGTAELLLVEPPADDTEGMAPVLWNVGMDYLARVRGSDVDLGQLLHGYVTTGLTNAIVSNVVDVTFNMGVPQTFDWAGLIVDADRAVLGYWPVDGLQAQNAEPKDFLVIGGAEGSLFENLIYEDDFGQDSVSTIKMLQLAIDAGVTVYKRWNTLPLPANTHPASVQTALQNAILGGNEVTFPADPMTIGDMVTGEWTGTAWIDMNPATGAAGYIISGGLNGGATYEDWPPEVIDLSEDCREIVKVEIFMKGGVSPTGDSPDPASVYTRDNEETLIFEYQVEVSYDSDDNGTIDFVKLLPSSTTYYQRETCNTTKSFFPGNYKFQVWISRRSWWFFNSTIAEAERNVSIVAVLIREQDPDEPEFGKAPPDFIKRSPAGGPPEEKQLFALVIPDEDPNGDPMVAPGDFSWSGGSLLTFMPTDQKDTTVESDTTGSSAEEDQDVDVVVDLPGGKQQQGYRKILLGKGSTDEKHKMTVIGIDVKKVFSEQIAGNECNAVDDSVSGQKMLMGSVSNFTTRISAQTELDLPASLEPKVRVGVREQGDDEVVGSEQAMPFPGKALVEFEADATVDPQSVPEYEVIAWFDENGDDELQSEEILDVFENTLLVSNIGDAAQVKILLFAGNVAAVGIAQDLFDFFDDRTAPAGTNVTTGSVAASTLSHAVGANWGGGCMANIDRLEFPATHARSKEFAEATLVEKKVKEFLNGKQTAIESYFLANPGVGSATFPAVLGGGVTWTYSASVSTGQWISVPSSWEPGFAAGLGTVGWNGEVPSVEIEEGTLKVLDITHKGGFEDLYDFDYNGATFLGAQICRWGAIVQAVWNLGPSGKVFFTKVDFERTTTSFGHNIGDTP